MSNDRLIKYVSKRGKDIIKIVTNYFMIMTSYEWEKKKGFSVL